VQLPFTIEQFFEVFSEYNAAVWPAQIALTFLAVALVLWHRSWSGVVVASILALLWDWLALAYHLLYFTRINPLAYGFSVMSAVATLVFLWHGVIHRRLRFAWVGGARGAAGVALIAYALLVYPTWSFLAGHRYPAIPTFGLPCPTTIFTIGILSFMLVPYPRSPFIIPVLWSAVGSQAAFLLAVPQDLGLAVAGVIGLVLMFCPRQPIRVGR